MLSDSLFISLSCSVASLYFLESILASQDYQAYPGTEKSYQLPVVSDKSYSNEIKTNTEKLSFLVRGREIPEVDLVFVLPNIYDSQSELNSAKVLATRLLSLFAKLNPVKVDKTHFGLISYDDTSTPLATIRLSYGITASNINKAKTPPFYIKRGIKLDLFRPLNLALKHISSEARKDSKRVLVIFISNLTNGKIKAILQSLLDIESEIFIFGIEGEDGQSIDMAHIAEIEPSQILTFKSYKNALQEVNNLLQNVQVTNNPITVKSSLQLNVQVINNPITVQTSHKPIIIKPY